MACSIDFHDVDERSFNCDRTVTEGINTTIS